MKTRGLSSTVAAAAVVAVLLVGVAGFFFLQSPPGAKTSSSTTTSSTTIPPLNITRAYLTHLAAFGNRTTCSYSSTCVYSYSVLNDYNNQSTVIWLGQSFGGPKNVTGLLSIQFLYQAITNIVQTMNITVLKVNSSANGVNVLMNVTGKSAILGPYQGTISAQASYTYSNGTWSISKEVWNYLSLTAPNANKVPGG